MRHLFDRKSFTLVLGAISILLLVILAAGLDSLEFREGTAFTFAEINDTSRSGVIGPPEMEWLVLPILIIVFIVTIFVVIIATPKQRRIILFILLGMTLVFLGIMWWISGNEVGGEALQYTATVIHTPVLSQATTLPTEATQIQAIYTPPKIASWFSIGITFAVLAIVFVLSFLFFRNRWRTRVSLEKLAGIAEQAVSDLQAGKDYGDVVINCYAKMIETVNKKQGIRRRGNLTPDEFVAVLVRARLPSRPIHRLTKLFERIRYGEKQASQEEIEEAVDCLNEIVSAIREDR